MSSCTPETNKVCEVYVHDVPTNGKIAIACGQTPFVFLICCIVLCGVAASAGEYMEV